MTMLTPQAAAKRAQVGRSTIVRALSDKTLLGVRDNRNRWKIDAEEIDRWAESRDQRSVTGHDHTDHVVTETVTPTDQQGEALTSARIEVARLEAVVGELRERLNETRADRDRWHALATAPRVGLLGRLTRSLTGRDERA